MSVLHVSDDLSTVRAALLQAQFWGLRMADSIYKEQFIEAGTKMERGPFRLLAAHEKSPVKH